MSVLGRVGYWGHASPPSHLLPSYMPKFIIEGVSRARRSRRYADTNKQRCTVEIAHGGSEFESKVLGTTSLTCSNSVTPPQAFLSTEVRGSEYL